MSQSDCAIVSYVTTMDFHLSRMSVMMLLQQIQHVIARANPNLSNHAHIITITIMAIMQSKATCLRAITSAVFHSSFFHTPLYHPTYQQANLHTHKYTHIHTRTHTLITH